MLSLVLVERVYMQKLLRKQITKTVELDYLLHLPPNAEKADSLPLILFLHGSGERGSDLARVSQVGLPKLVEADPQFPFIFVAPQCPTNTIWLTHFDALNALLDDVIAAYPVDTRRIYITGLSMGGTGTWGFAAAYPERAAAIVPVCGGDGWFSGDDSLCALKDTPTWTFHGALDQVIPLAETARMVRALKACGGNVRLTVYPDVEHNSWNNAYAEPELYTWLLEQHR